MRRTAAAGAEAAARGVILVVDDDQGNRELLGRRLAREGFAVHTAADGQAALELLGHQPSPPVELVLLDVMMPDLDGYEVLRRLKGDVTLRDIPVLMISALDEMDSVVRCIELGAEDYLPKPFDPVLLRARIGACLEKKRLRDQEARQARELAEWNRTLEQRVAEQVAQVERLGRLKRFFSPQLAELIVAGGATDPAQDPSRGDDGGLPRPAGLHRLRRDRGARGSDGRAARVPRRDGAAHPRARGHAGALHRRRHDGLLQRSRAGGECAGARHTHGPRHARARAQQLDVGWRKRGHDLGMGIGIAQGYATIGAIGFEGRLDYGAIGTVTNLAARLCGEASATEILVSQRVAGAVEHLVSMETLGPLTLKGFARPVPAFRVLGWRTP